MHNFCGETMNWQWATKVFGAIAVAMGGNALIITLSDCDTAVCWHQFVGHWFPALFIMFVSYHTDSADTKQLNRGMVAFGVLYNVLDLVQKGGDMDFDNFKVVQHFTFTATVSVLGIIRMRMKHVGAVFTGDFDKLIFFVVAVCLVVFMANHPQASSLGNWMHGMTAFYVATWYVLGVANKREIASWAMWFAAVCFLASQNGLCKAATMVRIDVVAYTCIVHLIALGMVAYSTKKSKSKPNVNLSLN